MNSTSPTMRQIIEERIETIEQANGGIKYYEFGQQRASAVEELEYIAFVLFSNLDIPKALKSTGNPDWVFKKISFDVVGNPKIIHQVQDVIKVTVAYELNPRAIKVLVSYKLDVGVNLTYVSEITLG